MSDEAKSALSAASRADWVVTGVQNTAADDGHAHVEVVIRGRVEGRVDRGGGMDRLRFSVWDDGQEMDFKVVDIPLGRGGVVNVRLSFDGRYAIVADGIGITITAGADADGERVFDLDPFFPEVRS